VSGWRERDHAPAAGTPLCAFAELPEDNGVERVFGDGPREFRVVVFRVGDERRLPYARRVVERVAGRRCLHDRARTARVVAWLCVGGVPPALDPDAGVAWTGGDGRWPNDSVDRLRAWATAGAPCDPDVPDAGAAP
jgi:hypothetical protein